MDHNIVQAGFGLRLRPVRLEDAEFILRLRCDPGLNRFISDTSPDVELQRRWMINYFLKHDDYYFCVEVEKTGRPVGAIAIYNILQDLSKAEWGRWIIASGVLAAPASAYLIYKTAFEILNLRKVYCRTVADNERVVSFHDRMGAECRGILKNDAIIRGLLKDHVLHEVDQTRWKIIAPKLFQIAEKAARFLE